MAKKEQEIEVTITYGEGIEVKAYEIAKPNFSFKIKCKPSEVASETTKYLRIAKALTNQVRKGIFISQNIPYDEEKYSRELSAIGIGVAPAKPTIKVVTTKNFKKAT